MTPWKEYRLKHLVRINSRSLPETTPPDYEFRYLDISAVGTGRLVQEPELLSFAQAPTRARRLVQPGDTIVSTVRTYLRQVWPVQGETDDLVVSTGFAVLSPSEVLESRYFGWWTQSDTFIDEVVRRSVGVAYPALNASEIGNIKMALPPIWLQRSIADHLEFQTREIDELVSMLGGFSGSERSSLSGLLLERRQVLVNDAVRGALDVTGARA